MIMSKCFHCIHLQYQQEECIFSVWSPFGPSVSDLQVDHVKFVYMIQPVFSMTVSQNWLWTLGQDSIVTFIGNLDLLFFYDLPLLPAPHEVDIMSVTCPSSFANESTSLFINILFQGIYLLSKWKTIIIPWTLTSKPYPFLDQYLTIKSMLVHFKNAFGCVKNTSHYHNLPCVL